VEELMSKNRYKKSFYQRGLRAMTLIEQALYSSLSPPQGHISAEDSAKVLELFARHTSKSKPEQPKAM